MQIAFLSVIYNNYEILNKNLKLVNSLNNNIDITFYIIDNSDEKNKSKIHENEKINYYTNEKYPKNNFKKNSFHHAYALDYGLKKLIESKNQYDFLIVSDPDYFLLGKNWIYNLCNFMNNESINIMGSPWGVKWRNKYKNFPCIQFSIYDDNTFRNIQTFAPCNYIGLKGKIEFNFNRIIYNKYCYNIFFKFFLNHVIDTGSSIFYNFKKYKTYLFEEIIFDKMNIESQNTIKEINLNHKKYSLNTAEVFKFFNINSIHFRYFGNLTLNNE